MKYITECKTNKTITDEIKFIEDQLKKEIDNQYSATTTSHSL